MMMLTDRDIEECISAAANLALFFAGVPDEEVRISHLNRSDVQRLRTARLRRQQLGHASASRTALASWICLRVRPIAAANHVFRVCLSHCKFHTRTDRESCREPGCT